MEPQRSSIFVLHLSPILIPRQQGLPLTVFVVQVIIQSSPYEFFAEDL